MDRLPPLWTVAHSAATYGIDRWSSGFFSVNDAGHVVVRPRRGDGPSIDIEHLTNDLKERGYALPLLVRFTDILAERIDELDSCFRTAMEEYEYCGGYQGVYPIKVNQQAQVVEQLLQCGRKTHLGLEVGSKPELLIALAMLDDPDALIICNGYKDDAYIETALLASKLGRNPILVMVRFRELERTIRLSREHGIRPRLGVRTKLLTRGAGHWAETGGSRSKFGLSTNEIMQAVEALRSEGMLDCFQLLHFHIGSQVPAIRIFKDALREASRIFVELEAMGAPMRYFDVGGGLAVDYDGSNTDFHSSMNYSLQEYANDVVAFIAEACRQRGVAEPAIVTEAGRALVAHHAVLIFDILDASRVAEDEIEAPGSEDHEIGQELYETWQLIDGDNLLEPYHDAVELREQAQQLFNLGYLGLPGRGRAEQLFFACCTRLNDVLHSLERVPEELDGLEKALADTYFCNFSLFQSMPDAWAVGQLFPVMPLHRHGEKPSRKGTLADITCDSDGKLDKFADLEDVKHVLDLHPPNGEPYYLGAFLVGAYQEILGDLHNLFGDTNAIHIALSGDRYRVMHVEHGDTVSEVLNYVAFDRRDMLRRVQHACEEALWHNRITPAETARLLSRFEEGLNAYTYLTGDTKAPTRAVQQVLLPTSERTPRNGS